MKLEVPPKPSLDDSVCMLLDVLMRVELLFYLQFYWWLLLEVICMRALYKVHSLFLEVLGSVNRPVSSQPQVL